MLKRCLYCDIEFLDESRSKNKIFCSTEHQGKHRWQHNKQKILEYNKNYEKLNKQKVRNTKNAYRKKKYQEDPVFAISIKLRIRIKRAITNKLRSSTDSLIGCSIEELKIYLESKFQPGMTWNNYSLYGWHIDHVIPLSSFDLTDPQELKKACHYTNLQPLWAKDNLSKSNKH
jgi:hypothetical protein